MSDSDDKVHAGFSQFKKAFRDHFYSVECGLKSMYIHKKRRSVSQNE